MTPADLDLDLRGVPPHVLNLEMLDWAIGEYELERATTPPAIRLRLDQTGDIFERLNRDVVKFLFPRASGRVTEYKGIPIDVF